MARLLILSKATSGSTPLPAVSFLGLYPFGFTRTLFGLYPVLSRHLSCFSLSPFFSLSLLVFLFVFFTCLLSSCAVWVCLFWFYLFVYLYLYSLYFLFGLPLLSSCAVWDFNPHLRPYSSSPYFPVFRLIFIISPSSHFVAVW